MANVQFNSIQKRYGQLEVFSNVDIDIAEGEFVVFVGPSGCGKSTLLRMLAGLESVSGGNILIGEKDVSSLPPRERDVAMVFQNYALYPHMTVAANIGFPLKMVGLTRSDVKRRVAHAADMLGLTAYLGRYPRELSGGQRQRVAMGRAVVREPDVFLFDEPLSNLDASLRVRMRGEIKRLHQRLGTTMIYVTHDQVEAMTLADRIVVLRAGRVEQIGTPLDLYNRPSNPFVAQFIGSPAMNIIEAMPVSQREVSIDGAILTLDRYVADPQEHTPVLIGIRPHDVQVVTLETPDAVGGEVVLVEEMGNVSLLTVQAATQTLQAETPSPPPCSVGDRVFLRFAQDKLHVFPAQQTPGLA